jgi:hypothetical protein
MFMQILNLYICLLECFCTSCTDAQQQFFDVSFSLQLKNVFVSSAHERLFSFVSNENRYEK